MGEMRGQKLHKRGNRNWQLKEDAFLTLVLNWGRGTKITVKIFLCHWTGKKLRKI